MTSSLNIKSQQGYFCVLGHGTGPWVVMVLLIALQTLQGEPALIPETWISRHLSLWVPGSPLPTDQPLLIDLCVWSPLLPCLPLLLCQWCQMPYVRPPPSSDTPDSLCVLPIPASATTATTDRVIRSGNSTPLSFLPHVCLWCHFHAVCHLYSLPRQTVSCPRFAYVATCCPPSNTLLIILVLLIACRHHRTSGPALLPTQPTHFSLHHP